MPINVPDHDAVVREAQKHKFREPLIDESDDQYRTALADHVLSTRWQDMRYEQGVVGTNGQTQIGQTSSHEPREIAYRANGDCYCRECGRQYKDHPKDTRYAIAQSLWVRADVPEYLYHRLCNGELVHL